MLGEDVAYLLEDFGSDLTLTRQAPGVYDPATGAMASTATATHTIRGVFINYADRNVDGTVVRMGDRRLLVRASDAPVTPAIGDRVDGLQVIDVRSIAPNGVAIAWACQMRK
jgi:hypothetical protein